MKKLLSAILVGGSIIATSIVSFAAPAHLPECGGTIYTEIKSAECGCPGECIKIYYCTECGKIGATTVHCPN